MKYEIKDLEKGKTIKSVQVVDSNKRVLENEKAEKIKVIMVNYLDGTQDIFEFNEATLKNIKNMVDTQAKTFVDKQSDKFPLWFEANVVIAGAALLLSLSAIFWDKMIIMGIISGIVSMLSAGNAVRINAKNKNIKKHIIYVDKIMGKLEEYNEILKKENALSKEQNKELINIINIDKKSVKNLEHIGNKIERYNEIEGKSPKKKSL